MNKLLTGSWITKAFGIFVLIASLGQIGMSLTDSDPNTKPNFEAFVVALTGAGLMTARQNNQTSEDVKATPKSTP